MGPLNGVRIVEFAGLGPAPFGAMMLADLGVEIIRVDRPGGYPAPAPSLDFEQFGEFAFYNRNRRTVRLDLKAAKGREAALRLATNADALIEGFRPGVTRISYLKRSFSSVTLCSAFRGQRDQTTK